MNLYSKRQPTSAGEILLKEFLEPLELSQSAFARHLGWPQSKVNEIVQGRRGISPETAMAFADALGTSAEFWLNVQQAMDLWKAKQKYKPIRRLPQIKKTKIAG